MRPPSNIDPGVVDALRAQLAVWSEALRGGAERIGWKIGLGLHDCEGQVARISRCSAI
jgi:hypothetical protein